jgi:hypothetical protein
LAGFAVQAALISAVMLVVVGTRGCLLAVRGIGHFRNKNRPLSLTQYPIRRARSPTEAHDRRASRPELVPQISPEGDPDEQFQ